MPTVHLIIKGRVQGVFFRATAKDVADEIGVRGWVKNTEEGYVEIAASGTDEQLQKFMAWCKLGPRKAIVTDVVSTPMPDEDFNSFTVVRK
ncbi:MAG TPA: acylphosphatase [Flavisolibacter sp.]|nr:acylphosphatase [Flavisolibacter sp.]